MKLRRIVGCLLLSGIALSISVTDRARAASTPWTVWVDDDDDDGDGQPDRVASELDTSGLDERLRVAQQQQAVHAADQDADPDPVVFPGERVAKLSDYVSILRDMQKGDMNGALARFGLDMASYTTVATAWGAKMAADPVLTEKFHRMLAP